MRTMARARFVRVSARKARLVLDQIRGKSVGDALSTLEYTPRAAARLVEKVLRSAVANAEHNHQVRNLDDLRVVQAIAGEHGSFDRYVWSFVDGRPRPNAWKTMTEIPAETAESRALSKDLIARGANFVGPTICYAFMQATGLVNDHLVSCFRYRQL